MHSLFINCFLPFILFFMWRCTIIVPARWRLVLEEERISLQAYLSSLEERVWRQLLQLVGSHIQPVELLQQREGSLRDEVQHVVVQAQRVEAGHPLQAAGSRLERDAAGAGDKLSWTLTPDWLLPTGAGASRKPWIWLANEGAGELASELAGQLASQRASRPAS